MNNIKEQLQEAKKVAAAYWPLTSFVASNHLWNCRDKNFFNLQNDIPVSYLPHDQDDSCEASLVELYSEQIGEFQFNNLKSVIAEKICRVLGRYFSEKNKTEFISIWAGVDQENKKKIVAISDHIKKIEVYINAIEIPNEILVAYFQKIYFHIYGWASFSSWLNEYSDNPWIDKKSALDEIVLMWLFYEYEVFQSIKKVYSLGHKKYIDSAKIKRQQQENELNYYADIHTHLQKVALDEKIKPDAQFVFCIDTRSEGLRRHIEAQGNYETLGCAGFFGVVFKLIKDGKISLQSPAIIKPEKKVYAKRLPIGFIRSLKEKSKSVSISIRRYSMSALALFEILGIWYFLYMLYKTLTPQSKSHQKNEICHYHVTDMSLEEKVAVASTFLKSIDLIEGFSDAVVICGHESNVTNNPFQSALNCGACGGNAGVANAIIICDIFNDFAVRAKLKIQHGIAIEDVTRFYPASHHTVNDRIEFLQDTPSDTIMACCDLACENLKKEKVHSYPFLKNLAKNEKNWSELVPELGLVNNACFIVGPRHASQSIDLQRRAFLHSYNCQHDQAGAVLTQIFSGPCIVAHWINMQYFLSTTNPSVFGAGNKAIHNVIPNIGVMEGNLSDLKVGLPYQSVYFKNELLHQPLRLTYFVFASEKQISTALQNSPDFAMLVNNEWVNLIPVTASN